MTDFRPVSTLVGTSYRFQPYTDSSEPAINFLRRGAVHGIMYLIFRTQRISLFSYVSCRNTYSKTRKPAEQCYTLYFDKGLESVISTYCCQGIMIMSRSDKMILISQDAEKLYIERCICVHACMRAIHLRSKSKFYSFLQLARQHTLLPHSSLKKQFCYLDSQPM